MNDIIDNSDLTSELDSELEKPFITAYVLPAEAMDLGSYETEEDEDFKISWSISLYESTTPASNNMELGIEHYYDDWMFDMKYMYFGLNEEQRSEFNDIISKLDEFISSNRTFTYIIKDSETGSVVRVRESDN